MNLFKSLNFKYLIDPNRIFLDKIDWGGVRDFGEILQKGIQIYAIQRSNIDNMNHLN